MMLNNDGQVTGATVEALVEKLTQHEKSPGRRIITCYATNICLLLSFLLELLFLRAFFYNFRLFTTPTIFLELLIKRFDIQPPSPSLSQDEWKLWTNHVLIPVRLRVYNVIKTWLETFFSYDTDACIEQPLIEFVTGSLMQVMAAPGKRMMELVRKCVSDSTTMPLSPFSSSINNVCSLHPKDKWVLRVNYHTPATLYDRPCTSSHPVLIYHLPLEHHFSRH